MFEAPLASSAVSPSLDEARARAGRLLTDGFAYDAITVEEFEWRLERLSRADTPPAIDALVADLATAGRSLAPGISASSAIVPTEGRIVGIMSETRRVGPWRVPQRLRVTAVMSEVKIDLRYAALTPGCMIDVTAVMANVSVIVPPGLVVDFDVSSIMASTRNDSHADGAGRYTLPHRRIIGTAVMAEVRVRVRALTP